MNSWSATRLPAPQPSIAWGQAHMLGCYSHCHSCACHLSAVQRPVKGLAVPMRCWPGIMAAHTLCIAGVGLMCWLLCRCAALQVP
jgi:hypothetical protein